jgi:hypothetical protein
MGNVSKGKATEESPVQAGWKNQSVPRWKRGLSVIVICIKFTWLQLADPSGPRTQPVN